MPVDTSLKIDNSQKRDSQSFSLILKKIQHLTFKYPAVPPYSAELLALKTWGHTSDLSHHYCGTCKALFQSASSKEDIYIFVPFCVHLTWHSSLMQSLIQTLNLPVSVFFGKVYHPRVRKYMIILFRVAFCISSACLCF